MPLEELRSDVQHEPAEQPGEHISPSSLRRISVETSSHRPRWFYRPCAEERRFFTSQKAPETGFPHLAYR